MTEPFLAQVARYYYQLYGREISKLRFVFPSKRALTFFRHYLGQVASDQPIFSPRMETIGDFIASLVPQVGLLDKTALLFELYEAYREVRSEQGATVESFDNFLYWGGLILKDFDSCDRYLVPVRHLYRNLRDLKELSDDFSYLSEEAKALLQRFWGNIPALETLSEEEAKLYKARFLSFWESLAPLYARLNERLATRGLAYEGARYRLASEAGEEILDELGDSPLIFVGLFQLTPSERRVFRRLRQAGRADFCWDASVAIVQDEAHPASRYYRGLVSDFGQVPGPWAEGRVGAHLPAEIEVIQAPSLLAQAKGLPAIFRELGVGERARELQAALILPDEGMLLPTASSIPQDIEAVNITLGYPLDKTPIAMLLHRWVALLEFGERRHHGLRYPATQLLGLLGHRLITEHTPQASLAMKLIRDQKRYYVPVAMLWEQCDDPLLRLLLEPMKQGAELLDRIEALLHYFIKRIPMEEASEEDEEAMPDLFIDTVKEAHPTSPLSSFDIEFIHHYLRLVTRLKGLVQPYLAGLELSSIVHLLDGLVSTITIPFEGDPLEGLQVMGLLETRGLHFDTLLYLSAQEGSLPSSRFTDTLIPFTLRRAFGLPVGGADDLGGDYTFFQSIARAERLIFIVAPASDASSLGEESRYISLLEYVYQCPVARRVLRLESTLLPAEPIEVPKEGELWQRFVTQSMTVPSPGPEGGKMISPSALTKYVICPLRFYYERVCSLEEEQQPSLLLASNELGTIVHAVLEQCYAELCVSLPKDIPLEARLSRGTVITSEVLGELLRQKGRLARIVETVYRREMELGRGSTLSNLAVIYCHSIEQYVRAALEADLEYAPFEYIASEEKMTLDFPLSDGRRVWIGGVIDRLDKKEGIYRIVDYKTGTASLGATQWDYLLDPNYKAILQTLIYSEIYQRRVLDQPAFSSDLYPAIYRFGREDGLLKKQRRYDPIVQLPTADDLEPVSKGVKAKRSYQEVAPVFTELLTTKILDRLFDEGESFVQTDDPKNCSYCPFALSCGR